MEPLVFALQTGLAGLFPEGFPAAGLAPALLMLEC